MNAILKISFILSILISPLQAKVLVLVHGYMSGANAWENSGIINILRQDGWTRTGLLFPATGRVINSNELVKDNKKIYLVDLPSLAPLKSQAALLHRALISIQSVNKNDQITLVGHSAGGVVSRLALVMYGAGQVKTLITIAAPHSGTHRALDALNFTHSGGPVGMFKSFFGGAKYHAVKNSTPLLIDLAPPRVGNILSWLNIQPHPVIDYISIVRMSEFGFSPDTIVPAASQDMNNVPALAGRSAVVRVAEKHELSPKDGYGLIQLLHLQAAKDKKAAKKIIEEKPKEEKSKEGEFRKMDD